MKMKMKMKMKRRRRKKNCEAYKCYWKPVASPRTRLRACVNRERVKRACVNIATTSMAINSRSIRPDKSRGQQSLAKLTSESPQWDWGLR